MHIFTRNTHGRKAVYQCGNYLVSINEANNQFSIVWKTRLTVKILFIIQEALTRPALAPHALKPCCERLGRDRRTKEESLIFKAAVLGEQQTLRLGLDTFGDDAQLQAPGHGDDRPDERRVAGIAFKIAHEGLVDLECVYGETFEIIQRRIPGAEVVHRKRHPEPGDRAHGGKCFLLHHRAFGELELEAFGWKRVGGEQLLHRAGKRLIFELMGRNIDTDVGSPEPHRPPGIDLRKHAIERPGPDGLDLTGIFGHRNELGR